MDEMPNSRRRDAIVRIAAALSKLPEEPTEAGGDRIAAALETIANWCEASNEVWDPMIPTDD